MARNIGAWQHDLIIHLLCSKKRLTTSQMAKVAKCSERSNIRKSMGLLAVLGLPQSLPAAHRVSQSDGRCPVRPPRRKTRSLVEGMAIFLFDEFNVVPSISSIKRALYRAGWKKKKAQQRASERNPQLRDFYQRKLSNFRSFHLVFVDGSGCDKWVGYRRTDWSSLGVTPIQVSKFHRLVSLKL
jgi:hypothetical protein